MNPPRQTRLPGAQTDLGRALAACRGSFATAGFLSLFVNLLLLVPAFYMLQVYDRVLPSSSESTLLMLTLIAVFLFVVMGGLEWIRAQIMIVASTRLDELLAGRVHDAVFAQTLATGGGIATAQPLNDLLQLRQFLTGPGLFAFFDAPWLPIYILVMFLFHPWFGVVAVVSAVILVALTLWSEFATRADLDQANREALEASQMTQRSLRNVEAVEAMGMLPGLRARWRERQHAMLGLQARASAKSGLIASLSRTFRLAIQSLILGLGAYLAIGKELTPGLVIAGAILLGRALAPLDLMISSWRGFVGARDAYRRLSQLFAATPVRERPMPLPAPRGAVRLEDVVVVPPGAAAPVLHGISLEVAPGTLLGVLGPSAAGKSTLARTILGLYRPARGSVRLDGAEIEQWDRAELGRHVGYLPQDVELLDGTVSENIARFGEVDAGKVVEAAQGAGIHEMVLRLPEGYQTRIAGAGNVLSAGQYQRVGLARALYDHPRLIVLDEPNSNLDREGDAALVQALGELRRSGCTVVVITHRAYVLRQVDRIVMLQEGRVVLNGPRDQVLAALEQAAAKASPATPPAATVSAVARPVPPG